MVSFRSIRRFVWGELPESKTERTLLFKIDWFILSYCCLMVSNSCPVSSRKPEHNEDAHSTSQIVSLANCTLRLRVNAFRCIPDLDRSNVSNAYVSGMKQDLRMYGTEYNVSLVIPLYPYVLSGCTGLTCSLQKVNTIFTCGYIIGMIPSRRGSNSCGYLGLT